MLCFRRFLWLKKTFLCCYLVASSSLVGGPPHWLRQRNGYRPLVESKNTIVLFCLSGSVGSENFAEKTFTDCLKPIIGGCGTPPNFAEKSFTDGSQTSKSAKVFSLESFLPRKFPAIQYLHFSVYMCSLVPTPL